MQGDKNKVNIQGSEKPVVTKTKIKSKLPHPFHIPYHILFAPDGVEPTNHKTVNKKDKSSNSQDSDATLSYALFSS